MYSIFIIFILVLVDLYFSLLGLANYVVMKRWSSLLCSAVVSYDVKLFELGQQ